MSTKGTIRYEQDESTGAQFHVYEDCFEPENIYLEIVGLPVEVDIQMDNIKPRVTARFSLAWALKLGIVDKEYVAKREQLILADKAMLPEGEVEALKVLKTKV